MLLYPKFGGSLTVTELEVTFQLLLKSMICLVVLIKRITTTIIGSNDYQLSLEKRWPQVVLVGKRKFTPKGLANGSSAATAFGNYLHIFYSVHTY